MTKTILSVNVGPHGKRGFRDLLAQLNACQIEDLPGEAYASRRMRAALAEIQANSARDPTCAQCGSGRQQTWGRTRSGGERCRCCDGAWTVSGLSGSAIWRPYRCDLVPEAFRDRISELPSENRTATEATN